MLNFSFRQAGLKMKFSKKSWKIGSLILIVLIVAIILFSLPMKNIHSSDGKVAPILFILSGPSGVGKDTVAKRLLRAVGDKNLKKTITTTTRQPRKGEVDGVDYHFISREEFLKRIERSEFLEYANVHGNYYYGSSRTDIESTLSAGINVLLLIDVAGVEQILKQKNSFRVVTIFIAPKSLDELRQRIAGRGSETEESMAKRLQTAENEIKKAAIYDYVITSGSRDEDFAALLEIYEKVQNK
ncbi:MAG: guanylate kinase [Puniceicoccales bacterium]|nr:guanylate kinase [Puniceicoccales bacterium]